MTQRSAVPDSVLFEKIAEALNSTATVDEALNKVLVDLKGQYDVSFDQIKSKYHEVMLYE